ncbi:DUF4446 family protein [Petralouisia muris]|uniref:DUF4446 family protein n=1 Tax=Petralouisia muris TaxID=3032872 RepID=A0AC61RVG3_9FIRM|nr:DUF4446 family protein [Petralouisia muris]TGY95969.1 DUF4446 family protein [Petralouisia muris]
MKSDFIGLYFTVDDFLLTFAIMAAVMLLLFILLIVNIIKSGRLRKKYEAFMMGKNAESLEDTLIKRIQQVDELLEFESENRENIQKITNSLNNTFQKVGMVKYDAFHEMGGKLSFSLALLDQKNDGFIINAMHTREGCYTYIKEIVSGNSIIVLADEEKEALDIAMGTKKSNVPVED